MPDITLCKDEMCDLKTICLRYTLCSSYYQSYFTKSPREQVPNKMVNKTTCDYFIRNDVGRDE